jgi:hypothetical protein
MDPETQRTSGTSRSGSKCAYNDPRALGQPTDPDDRSALGVRPGNEDQFVLATAMTIGNGEAHCLGYLRPTSVVPGVAK